MQVSGLLKSLICMRFCLFQAKRSSIHCTLEVRFMSQLLRGSLLSIAKPAEFPAMEFECCLSHGHAKCGRSTHILCACTCVTWGAWDTQKAVPGACPAWLSTLRSWWQGLVQYSKVCGPCVLGQVTRYFQCTTGCYYLVEAGELKAVLSHFSINC